MILDQGAIDHIKWKIKQFENNGNKNKARIYKAKLKGSHGIKHHAEITKDPLPRTIN